MVVASQRRRNAPLRIRLPAAGCDERLASPAPHVGGAFGDERDGQAGAGRIHAQSRGLDLHGLEETEVGIDGRCAAVAHVRDIEAVETELRLIPRRTRTAKARRPSAPQAAVVHAIADDEGMRGVEQRPDGATARQIGEPLGAEVRLIGRLRAALDRDRRAAHAVVSRQPHRQPTLAARPEILRAFGGPVAGERHANPLRTRCHRQHGDRVGRVHHRGPDRAGTRRSDFDARARGDGAIRKGDREGERGLAGLRRGIHRTRHQRDQRAARDAAPG